MAREMAHDHDFVKHHELLSGWPIGRERSELVAVERIAAARRWSGRRWSRGRLRWGCGTDCGRVIVSIKLRRGTIGTAGLNAQLCLVAGFAVHPAGTRHDAGKGKDVGPQRIEQHET